MPEDDKLDEDAALVFFSAGCFNAPSLSCCVLFLDSDFLADAAFFDDVRSAVRGVSVEAVFALRTLVFLREEFFLSATLSDTSLCSWSSVVIFDEDALALFVLVVRVLRFDAEVFLDNVFVCEVAVSAKTLSEGISKFSEASWSVSFEADDT